MMEIRQACLRARDVVRQILTFSRQNEHELSLLKLVPLLQDSLKLIRSTIPASIDIRQHLNCKADTVLADPTKINQILINLCTNAAYAMRSQGGTLEICIENVELDEYASRHYSGLRTGRYVSLKVSDTGSGIDPPVLGRIFEPYFTTKPIGEGTGMGLAVVHGIVKGHGGEITVESTPDSGTTFEILLPVSKEAAGVAVKTQTPVLQGSERILYVEDEELLINAVRPNLIRLGYRVDAKKNSREALTVFRDHPGDYDLVITDQSMPEMTGDLLAKELLIVRPDIPIILITGYSEVVNEEKAKAIGIKAFVMKPVSIQELAETIRRVLEPQQRAT